MEAPRDQKPAWREEIEQTRKDSERTYLQTLELAMWLNAMKRVHQRLRGGSLP
ncbi:MAG: hypothetical protein HY400_01355 [Elusimicrobia bacterium]|nr:hypothetical protein [Elusimicrobiota bacterium]